MGLTGYLGDSVHTTPAIFSYLCRTYRIQNVPYGSEKVNYDRISQSLGPVYLGKVFEF